MNVTVLMVIKENSVKTLSIGVHRILAIMAQHAFNKRTFFDAIARRGGLVKCVMLKWFRAKMQHIEKELRLKISAIMEHARILETHINVTASKATPDLIVKLRSMNVNHCLV
jgi:hypothetical protein